MFPSRPWLLAFALGTLAGRPVLAVGERRNEVFAYFERITGAADLPPVSVDRGTGEVAAAA